MCVSKNHPLNCERENEQPNILRLIRGTIIFYVGNYDMTRYILFDTNL